MKYARALAFAAAAAITVVTATGCAVARNQETLGAYVDDAGITTAVKAKMAALNAGDSVPIAKMEQMKAAAADLDSIAFEDYAVTADALLRQCAAPPERKP